jgi:hypothetical protein
MASAPRITGLLDCELGDWRGQVYGLINPPVVAIYTVIPIGSLFWYTKVYQAGANSTIIFVGPWPDSATATAMANSAKKLDGF